MSVFNALFLTNGFFLHFNFAGIEKALYNYKKLRKIKKRKYSKYGFKCSENCLIKPKFFILILIKTKLFKKTEINLIDCILINYFEN